MKTKIRIEKEVELKLLIVKAAPRYWEDSEVNDENDTEDGQNIPCKNGDLWSPHIDIDKGQILNWAQGVKAEIHYKVCDCCGWEIQDDKGEIVLSAKDGYVPSTLYPKDNGFGDYIIMDIDENGLIANWKFNIFDFIEEY